VAEPRHKKRRGSAKSGEGEGQRVRVFPRACKTKGEHGEKWGSLQPTIREQKKRFSAMKNNRK